MPALSVSRGHGIRAAAPRPTRSAPRRTRPVPRRRCRWRIPSVAASREAEGSASVSGLSMVRSSLFVLLILLSPFPSLLFSQQLAGDDEVLDFGRPLIDTKRADVAVESLHDGAARDTLPAEELHGRIDHLLRGLSGVGLRHRG